jgi:hypothetical protein
LGAEFVIECYAKICQVHASIDTRGMTDILLTYTVERWEDLEEGASPDSDVEIFEMLTGPDVYAVPFV